MLKSLLENLGLLTIDQSESSKKVHHSALMGPDPGTTQTAKCREKFLPEGCLRREGSAEYLQLQYHQRYLQKTEVSWGLKGDLSSGCLT